MPQGLRGPSVRAGWLVAVGLVSGAGLTGCLNTEKKPVPPARQVGPGPAASGPNARLAPGHVGSTLTGITPTSGTTPAAPSVGATPPALPNNSPAPASASKYPGTPFENYGGNQIPSAMRPVVPQNPAQLPVSPAAPSGFTPAPAVPPANAGTWNDRPVGPRKPAEVAMATPPQPVSPPASVIGLPGPSDQMREMMDGLGPIVPPPAPTAGGAAAPVTPPGAFPAPVAPQPPATVPPRSGGVINHQMGYFGAENR